MTALPFAAIGATWPPAAETDLGPFRLRDGAGGGKRVSAASATGPWDSAALDAAEAAMRARGQIPLFVIREGDAALDAALAERGYAVADPTVGWIGAAAPLAARPIPPVTAWTVWEPLAVMHEIWAAGGIGPARVAVMHRAAGPRTGLFGRIDDQPAGAGFVAVHDGIAMVHALEILADHRRKGLARHMMHRAARWATAQGAHSVAVLCTAANAGANALYAGLDMTRVPGYHYRIAPDERRTP